MRGAIALCAVLGALSLLVVVSLPGAAQGPPVDNITRYGGPRLEVLRRVASGVQPKSVRVSPDGRRVYVCNFGRPDRENVFVYDADTLERVGVIEFLGNAVETAFSPDGDTLYVSNFRENTLEVVDVDTLRVTNHVRLGARPKTIAPSPDGSL